MANLMLLFVYLSFNIISTFPACRGSSSDIDPPDPPNVGCVPDPSLKCGHLCKRDPCSPPMASSNMASSTRAKFTTNDFSEGGEGREKSECDGQYHNNSKLILALSTRWYENGSRCGKMILITANNGKSVLAKVVDKIDSMSGRDKEDNIVGGSDGVWNALGLDKSIGEVNVTWSMA